MKRINDAGEKAVKGTDNDTATGQGDLMPSPDLHKHHTRIWYTNYTQAKHMYIKHKNTMICSLKVEAGMEWLENSRNSAYQWEWQED